MPPLEKASRCTENLPSASRSAVKEQRWHLFSSLGSAKRWAAASHRDTPPCCSSRCAGHPRGSARRRRWAGGCRSAASASVTRRRTTASTSTTASTRPSSRSLWANKQRSCTGLKPKASVKAPIRGRNILLQNQTEA